MFSTDSLARHPKPLFGSIQKSLNYKSLTSQQLELAGEDKDQALKFVSDGVFTFPVSALWLYRHNATSGPVRFG